MFELGNLENIVCHAELLAECTTHSSLSAEHVEGEYILDMDLKTRHIEQFARSLSVVKISIIKILIELRSNQNSIYWLESC